MNRTKIEWTDYTWNPVTGCTRGCSYCYARRMANRLKGRYGYNLGEPFRPTFHKNRLEEPSKLRKPSKIFTCSMGELFDPKSNQGWTKDVFKVMEKNSQHIFQVLTKQADLAVNAIDEFGYIDNLWLGCSQDGVTTSLGDIDVLSNCDPVVNFVSFEPLLGPIKTWPFDNLDWIIVGAQTGIGAEKPKPEWVQTILDAAYDIPVFLKNNLNWPVKIQEFPKVK